MTDQEKQVREIIIDVFEFPHVPYWFTIRQVSGILKKSISGGKCLRPLAALVFDEKYNLMGHIETKDILAGIAAASRSGSVEHQDSISAPKEETLTALKELSDKPVSILMTPFKHFADPEDSVSKAAELMLRNNLQILPVLENQKKLVGVVRSTEIFEYLSSRFFLA
ncbi:MAG: CBS domain-containing protein [Nitrospirae bacterium]|nr:CBS domain-containing protein [Nitrospirota bacterium]